jgi:Leucine-rich repeat (LRR) protein
VLATALQNNTTLKSLDLSNNPISTVSNYTGEKPYPITGLNALADAINASQSLDAITLEGGKLPVFQLKGDGQKQKVRLLDLSRKSLSFVSSIFMGTLLRGNTYINELVLHSNELTPTGATIVVKQLSRSLKSLDITNIVIVEAIVVVI